jgi:hypothetical protein
LNALFFACNEAKEKGYVYIFDNWFQIDITEIIEEFQRQSVFDLFVGGNSTVINTICCIIKELFEIRKNLLLFTGNAFILPGGDFINQLFCRTYCAAKDMYCEKNKSVIDKITYAELKTIICAESATYSNEEFTDVSEIFNGHYKAVDIERERFSKLLDAICRDDVMSDITINKNKMDDVMYYIMFILYCFRVMKNLGESKVSNEYKELFPVMIYRPKITFDRARLQQGYFIYTPYMAASGSYRDTEVKMNNISPIQIVEINNPVQILSELENIGINKGTIFGDYDNIAKHIKEKADKQRSKH